MDCRRENGSMLVPKSHRKLSSQEIYKNALGASPLVPNWVQGIEVGGQNRSKNEEKTKLRWEGILASIFVGFRLIFGVNRERKSKQKRSKKASKKKIENRKAPRMPENPLRRRLHRRRGDRRTTTRAFRMSGATGRD